MSQANKHRIILPTLTACALWACEVQGQLSDGTWENSTPHNHWQFWGRCNPEVGEQLGVVTRTFDFPTRTKYNIINLMNVKWEEGDNEKGYILRGRMLKMGRMAKALEKLNRPFSYEAVRHVEYLPEKLYQFQACRMSGIWEYDFVGKYMEAVVDELAAAYYETEYSVDELRADLNAINDAMRVPTRKEEAPAAATA